MVLPKGKQLKEEALQRLGAAPGDPQKMVFFHALISSGVSLGCFLISVFLNLQIEHTTGLGGMQTRSLLSSLDLLVTMVPTVFMLFWAMSYTYSILQAVRGRHTGLDTLKEGFYRFGPVLRYSVLESCCYTAVSMLCLTPATMIFAVLPIGTEVLGIAQQGMESGLESLTPEMENAMMDAGLMMGLVYGLCLVLVAWLVSIPIRMAPYALMEQEKKGAFAAFRESFQRMKGHWGDLVKLDLSFWWYYLLLALSQLIVNLDVILGIFSVELPVSALAAKLVCCVVGFGAMVAVSVLTKNRVMGAYALFYEYAGLEPETAEIQDQPRDPEPKNVPWQYS